LGTLTVDPRLISHNMNLCYSNPIPIPALCSHLHYSLMQRAMYAYFLVVTRVPQGFNN